MLTTQFSASTATFWGLFTSLTSPGAPCPYSTGSLVPRHTNLPSPSSRQHLSNDNCLQDKMKDYQNCSVLCCVRQLFTVIGRHMWTVLTVNCWFRFSFWATVCKTVRPMLSDRCLSCPVCLSVTFVHCGQTIGRIKVKLCMHVGLGPGHIVLDGDPAPPLQRDTPQLSAHICCGQMAAWIKMSLVMELGLGQGDFALDRDYAPPP